MGGFLDIESNNLYINSSKFSGASANVGGLIYSNCLNITLNNSIFEKS